MAARVSKNTAVVGVSDHAGWAVLITAAGDGTFIDRRRVELVDDSLPCMPHHHDALKLPVEKGVELVERVRSSANVYAAECLDVLARDVPAKISGIALRKRPPLPPTVAERLADYRAQNVADWVMYREALAGAAEARGWFVDWYDAKTVLDEAARALGRDDIEDMLAKLGKSLGPPWQKDHRMAMAAAIAAGRSKKAI